MSTIAPLEAKTQKAFCWYPEERELIFGTLCSAPLDVLRQARREKHIRGALDVAEPEVAALSAAHCREEFKPELPVGWRLETWRWSSRDELSEIFYYYFEVEHGLEFRHPHGGRMPQEILWLLSGSLQTGEEWNYHNYQQYCRPEGLKFLPLLITHQNFRFFIFRPTPERVVAGIERFQSVLSNLHGMGLTEVAYEVLRAKNLNEVFVDPKLWSRNITGMAGLIGEFRPLCFVYQDLEGNQDAIRFAPG